MVWFWVILGIIYILSPYDLFPDFFPIRGWLDDAVIVTLLVRWFIRYRKQKAAQAQYRSYQQTHDSSQQSTHRQTTDDSDRPRDPHTILGVSRQAGQEEIRVAYRKLAGQYHPDRVAHLGREFQVLAEKRFKEIQQAYDALKK